MVSHKLKTIFGISIPIFIVHGLEEYFTGFFNIDPISQFVFSTLNTMPASQATFLLFQTMLWILLVISFLFIVNEKWHLRLMIIPGLVYIFEFHHFWEAIVAKEYYPGLVTAFAFPFIAFFFWKELLRNFQKIDTVRA